MLLTQSGNLWRCSRNMKSQLHWMLFSGLESKIFFCIRGVSFFESAVATKCHDLKNLFGQSGISQIRFQPEEEWWFFRPLKGYGDYQDK